VVLDIIIYCKTGSYAACLMLFIVVVSDVYSHGTKYEVLKSDTVYIKAMFETGEPMTGCDVLVFPPGNTVPSDTLTTDSSGVFGFKPEKTEGDWVLQVRAQGGHGLRINYKPFDTGSSGEPVLSTSAIPETIKNWICALCVLWGFIGTALFFKRRK